MSLLLLVYILVDYSEMPLSNVVGDATYGLLVQFYCLTATIFNAINGLDLQKQFLSIKKIQPFFVSIVYLNSFLINVVVPPVFFLSSVSHSNSSTFLHFNHVYFVEFRLPPK